MKDETHRNWWLENTDDGRLYGELHNLQGGEKCHERAFWLDGKCPKCGHNGKDIYKPDLLEKPYEYECQRRYNPIGFAHLQCLYEGSVAVDKFGAGAIRKLMKIKIEKLNLIKRLVEIDDILKPYIQTIEQPEYYFGSSPIEG